MSIIGDIGDPKKDAAAFGPVIDEDLKDFAAALCEGLKNAAADLTVTITISKKGGA